MSSIFKRFEIRRVSPALIALLLWVILHFGLIIQLNNQYWFDSLPLRAAPLVAAVVVLCCSAELLALALLAGIAKGLVAHPKRLVRAAAILPLALLYGYFLLITVSWTLFNLGIGFLDADIIRAFLVNTAAVWKHFSHLELLLALTCLAMPVLLMPPLLMLSPSRAEIHSLKTPAALLLCALCGAVVLLRLIPERFPDAEQRTFRASIGNGMLPGLGLFWSPLLPPAREPEVSDFSAELTPQYSLQHYAATIQSGIARPNIIFVIVEALRSDMVNESVDGSYVMPALHELAKQGTLIENVAGQSTESAYSMTSILTGLYPMKFGIRDTFVSRAYPHVRVYDVLAAAGYRAGFFSSANEHWQNMAKLTESPLLDIFFHSESDPAAAAITASGDDGFPRALAAGQLKTGKLDDAVTIRRLIDWLNQSRQAQPSRPLFATLSLQASHFPYQQGTNIPEVFLPSSLSKEERSAMSFLDYPETLAPKMKNRYRNSLRYIDGLLNELLAFLRQAGLVENTVLVVTGDHGELFREHGLVTHGSALLSTALSVPLVIYQHGKTFRIEPQQPRLLDVAPTIVDLAGLPPHANFQGQSMLRSATEAPVFATLEGLSMQDAVIFRGKKLIFDRRAETFHFYDLVSDPHELKELKLDNSPSLMCLQKLLSNFRARQLKYYKSFDLYSKYFPPRHDEVPEVCT